MRLSRYKLSSTPVTYMEEVRLVCSCLSGAAASSVQAVIGLVYTTEDKSGSQAVRKMSLLLRLFKRGRVCR